MINYSFLFEGSPSYIRKLARGKDHGMDADYERARKVGILVRKEMEKKRANQFYDKKSKFLKDDNRTGLTQYVDHVINANAKDHRVKHMAKDLKYRDLQKRKRENDKIVRMRNNPHLP